MSKKNGNKRSIPNVLFIHRSVGRNLIKAGKLHKLATDAGLTMDDYDHNTGTLRGRNTEKKLSIVFEGGNTNPDNYALLFSEDGAKNQKAAHKLVNSYEVVIIKSCYPNSNITSDKHLETLKDLYQQICKFFREEWPDKKLIILTSPPLVPLKTYSSAGDRARKLSDWLSSGKLGANVAVFNFFDHLADSDNLLKKGYRRFIPIDSHPNKRASKHTASLLIEFIKEEVV